MLVSLGFRTHMKRAEAEKLKKFEEHISLYKEEPEVQRKLINLNKEGEEIAIIEIPSIDLRSVITQGTSEENLKYNIGHFKHTRMPGEPGNFCIAGHNSNIYNEVLNNVHRLKKGDLIKIITAEDEYSYYVKNMSAVNPDNVEVLNDVGDRKLMTIVTCTDKGDKRLIVTSEMD